MIAGVLLSAGESTRMGSDKALVKTRGQSFLAHGVRHLWAACDSVVVVLGANAAKIQAEVEREFEALVQSGALQRDLAAAHRHDADGLEVQFELNKHWKKGMFSSAQAGIGAALDLRPQAVMVLPVDHPEVQNHTVAALATLMLQALASQKNLAERRKFCYALVPRHLGRRGHPVALSPELARAVVRDGDAENLSDAIKRHARLIGFLDVKDPGVVRNINRPKPGLRRASR
jgi:CTP:molybdopterin cytidylyltransferase MocA